MFELDLERRELRRRGLFVPLPPQPFAVLERLASRPGRIVTREELRRLLWPEGIHVDHERGLNHCLNRIRRVLGDVAHAPRFVETLPRQGYRFLADVEVVLDAVETGEPPAPAPAVRVRPGGARAAAVVAAALVLVLQGPGLPRRSRAGGPGLTSFDSTAQASYHAGRKLLDEGPAGWRRSIDRFEDAIRRDPSFALAHYGLADAYMRLGEHGALAADEAFPAARRAARAALAIEDRAEPLVILGAVALNYDWDWAFAERTYARAIALDPELPAARLGLARLLSAAGRHAEALQRIQDAEARSPSCPLVVRDSAFVHYRARRYDEAGRRLRDWAALEPSRPDPHHWLALLLMLRGRKLEAVREARAVYDVAQASGPFVQRFEALAPAPAMDYYLRGSIEYLKGRADSQWVPRDVVARLRAGLGQHDEALADLEGAADERSPTLLPHLSDPAFDALRSDPRFQALCRRVRLPEARQAPVTVADARS